MWLRQAPYPPKEAHKLIGSSLPDTTAEGTAGAPVFCIQDLQFYQLYKRLTAEGQIGGTAKTLGFEFGMCNLQCSL